MVRMIYRVCDLPSSNPSPILDKNRQLLNKMCLRSVVEAYQDVEKLFITFILDNCKDGWIDWIDQNVPFACEVIESSVGINDTYLHSLEVAREAQEEVFIFQECDYLYRGYGQELIDSAIAFGFVSPYDHPDKYPSDEVRLNQQSGFVWRSAPSTTMTFATTKTMLMRHYEDLARFGYLDQQMWENLPAQLWTPIPSIATHMVKDYMAPNIDWKTVWTEFL